MFLYFIGGNADVVSIWDEEGRPYMQFVHFCFAFGGILSPLMSEPFFAKKQCVPNDSFNNTGKHLQVPYSCSIQLMTRVVGWEYGPPPIGA